MLCNCILLSTQESIHAANALQLQLHALQESYCEEAPHEQAGGYTI